MKQSDFQLIFITVCWILISGIKSIDGYVKKINQEDFEVGFAKNKKLLNLQAEWNPSKSSSNIFNPTTTVERIWKHSPTFKENIESSHTMNIQDNGYTCQSLPETYSPFMTCSGLVDYSFLVAPSASLESMELEAQTMAGYYSSLSSMLPNTCVSSIKKAICASIYLPCIPSIMTGKAI
jgi:hypothetical protein